MEDPIRNVLVTGASGFVGAAICSGLHTSGFAVRGAIRSLHSSHLASNIEPVAVCNLDAATDWSWALAGVDCVIHCAARAHVMHETEADALAAYRSVNVDGSWHLAEQAAAAGVRRLVYLSSIGVLGIYTNGRGPFFVSDAPKPVEDYAVSKWEAEQALWAVAANTGLEVVVVRPPLVYGPGAKGNLARLRTRSTISRHNPASLRSHQAVADFAVIDELPNDYLLIEFPRVGRERPVLGM